MTLTIEEFKELVDEATTAEADIVSALECGYRLALAFKRAGITRAAAVADTDARIERITELQEHERQTHERLGAILGTDDSLEELARHAIERIAELEHIAAQTMEWAAGYPHSPIADELAVSMIYDLCARVGIGQSKEKL